MAEIRPPGANVRQTHAWVGGTRGATLRHWVVGGLLLLIGGGWVIAVPRLHSLGCGAIAGMTTVDLGVQLFSSVAFGILGALVVIYRPRNRVGWLALWGGLGALSSFASWSGLPCAAEGYLTPPFLPFWALLGYAFIDIALFVPIFILIPLLFPTGRALSRRWATLFASGLALQTLLRTAMALVPDFSRDNGYGLAFDLDNPIGLGSLPDWWYPVFRNSSVISLTVLILGAIAALVVRYRRSTGDERQQVKWLTFFFATAVTIQLLVFELPGNLFYPQIFMTEWYSLILIVVFVGYPVVVGLAIFKYRLYDIDLIINRTVVYGALTGFVALLYILIVAGSGLLFNSGNSLSVSLLATGVIALLFNPARLRIQSAANRWLFGERDDPAGVLARLTHELETAHTEASPLDILVETIATSLKLPYVALRVDPGGDAEPLAAERGRPVGHLVTIPLLHRQERVGMLLVAPRSPGETLSAADERLLTAIARLAATTVRTIQLTDEVQEARVRTVTAREEERRRLRRDLHDGLGPVLASQGLKLAAARQLLRDRPEHAERLLDEVMDQTESTVGEVRRLVYALRPPMLDELGLVEAIHEHAETVGSTAELRITLDAPLSIPPIPAAVEVAAFRIVQEALNNVVRHAGARRCSIAIRVDDALRLRVEDDGAGLPEETRSGVGLLSMRERAAEVGGSCRIENGERGGVIVRITLPLAPREEPA